MPYVVNFCGGRGATSIIREICKRDGWTLTNIVNAYDDGKSTGEMRRMFGMLGPSDLRKTQLAMSSHNAIKHIIELRFPSCISHDDAITLLWACFDLRSKQNQFAKLINCLENCDKSIVLSYLSWFFSSLKRFESYHNNQFNFANCSFGNILYVGAYESLHCNFSASIAAMGQLLQTNGISITNSDQNLFMAAIGEDGRLFSNEAEIVETRSSARIYDFYLLGRLLSQYEISVLNSFGIARVEKIDKFLRSIAVMPKLKREVVEAIQIADVILLSPGTQHSSIYPTLRTQYVGELIRRSSALKIMVCNIGEDYETPGYTASDFVKGAIAQLRLSTQFELATARYFDLVLVNEPSLQNGSKLIDKYVVDDVRVIEEMGIRCLHANFEDPLDLGKHNGQLVVDTIESELNAKH